MKWFALFAPQRLKWVGRLLVAAIIVIAIAVWLLIPVAFVRGMMAGGFAAVVTIVAMFKLATFLTETKDPRPLDLPLLPGDAWDFNMRLTDTSGRAFDATEFKGRVTVLYFCRSRERRDIAEISSLNALRQRTESVGVQFACIARRQREMVDTFVAEHAPGMPVYGQTLGPVRPQRRLFAFTTIIVDKNGDVALANSWPSAWDGEAVTSFVLKLATASH